MKKIASAFAAMMLVLSMAACGDGEPKANPQPTATVTVTPTPETTPTPEVTPTPTVDENSQDDVFLSVVREEFPGLVEIPDADLIELATNACDALDRGASAQEVISVIQKGSSTQAGANMFGYVVGAGVGVYCPEHIEKFEALVNQGV